MQKKRLESALNAAKLINLGFNLDNSKIKTLNLLYNVNCVTSQIFFHEKPSLNADNQITKLQNSSKNSESNEINCLVGKNKDYFEELKTDDYLEKVEVLCLQFNPNQNILATGDSNGNIQLYDIFSALPLKQENDNKKPSIISDYNNFPINLVNNIPAISIKWHPVLSCSTSFVYFAYVNGYIGILETTNVNKAIIIEENDEISCIDFNLEGTCLATVGKDSNIKLYDSNFSSGVSHKLIRTFGLNKNNYLDNYEISFTSTQDISFHSNRIQSVKFSDVSNEIFFTGGWDRSIKMWDKRVPTGLINNINGPFICGSDAIDVKENLLLTASWVKENSLELWDVRHSKKHISSLQIKDFNESGKYNGEYLYGCKFFSKQNNDIFTLDGSNSLNAFNDALVLACGSGTQSLHLLDYKQSYENQLISSYKCKSPLYCLDSIYSSRLIACGGMNSFYVLNANSV